MTLEPRLPQPVSHRRFYARGPMAAAALVTAGFTVIRVEPHESLGRTAWVFPGEVYPALQKFLAAFAEVRAMGLRAEQERQARREERHDEQYHSGGSK